MANQGEYWVNLRFLFSGLLIMLLSGCNSDSSTPAKLDITGSSTIAPVIGEIAAAFERSRPGIRIDVQTGGSSRGLNDVVQGTADIGMVSRHLNATESYRTHLLARDGVTIITHQSNPVSQLTRKQILDIYQKKITNWKALGGPDKPITVISKAEGRSTLEVFLKYLGTSNRSLKPDTIIGDNEQAIKLVSTNPRAIAYVSVGAAQYNVEQNVPIKLTSIENIDAQISNIQNGSFPIVRELNLVYAANNIALVNDFIQFTHSKESRQIIQRFGFVPAG